MPKVLEAKRLGMPICRFCGTQAEEGRTVRPGWQCRGCFLWQDHCATVCTECGQTVQHTRVIPPPLLYKLD